MTKCLWCNDASADENSPGVPETLCRYHRAEYEGLNLSELERMEREEYAEWVDAYPE